MNKTSRKLLSRVSTVHAVSHIFIMTIPALLPILPEAMGVSFTELGIAVAVFNIISALVQAPIGFLVDRVGAKKVLIVGLVLGSFSYSLLFFFPTYFCLLLAMALAGLANGVYHPSDYSLLSNGIGATSMGRAFSVHTFAGLFGGATTPLVMVGVAVAFGVQWAFAVATLIGLAALAFFLSCPDVNQETVSKQSNEAKVTERRPTSISVYSIAILTVFFMLLSLSMGGIERFSVSSLIDGFGLDLVTANYALTAFMFASAAGVLAGGIIADKINWHGLFAFIAFAIAGLIIVGIILIQLPAIVLIVLFGIAGFLMGSVAPSRDMLVRKATPQGAEGRTFGIVTTGFNIGGVFGPILFGYLLDNQLPIGVLWLTVGFVVMTLLVIIIEKTINKRRLA